MTAGLGQEPEMSVEAELGKALKIQNNCNSIHNVHNNYMFSEKRGIIVSADTQSELLSDGSAEEIAKLGQDAVQTIDTKLAEKGLLQKRGFSHVWFAYINLTGLVLTFGYITVLFCRH